MDLSRFTGPVAGFGLLMIAAGLGDALFSHLGNGIQIFNAITGKSPTMAWALRGGLVGVGLIVTIAGGLTRK